MTTRLAGFGTDFLPFDQGDEGAAGNPLNPNGHRTAYLWEQVWQRDSWLEILGRYLVAERNDKKQISKIIFPRFHQLDATRKLQQAVLSEGAGQKYLIQHSAGSGKTNSIAWSAHFLADLHDADNKKVFDTVLSGTPVLIDIFSGPEASNPTSLVNVDGTLFFSAESGAAGKELWKSDGTEVGTVRVADINVGIGGSFPSSLTNFNGTVFFSADNEVLDRTLWKSDGTSLGTVPVAGFSGLLAPSSLTTVGGTIFFSASGALWKSNGNQNDTVQIGSPLVSSLTAVNGLLFFTSPFTFGAGRELGVSDGSNSGTGQVANINPGFLPTSFPMGSSPSSLTDFDDTLFFTADDGVHGVELWKSDGTDGGTVLVADITSGFASSSPASLTTVNGTLFFSANDGVNGRELWKSDGTTEGTVRVLDINPDARSSSPAHLTNVDGTLFFSADDGINGIELWQSNGSGAGTRMVANLDGTSFDSTPSELTNVDGRLFFNATDGAAGTELWTSDGTEAGTFRVADINPGIGISTPRNLTNVDGTLFFTADDGSNGRELWTLNSAAVASAIPHSLVLPGGGGDYAVQISGSDVVVFKTGDIEVFRQPLNLVSSLEITGSSANDCVTVLSALTPVEIPLAFDGSGGNDFFDGRQAIGPMTLMGGAGNDNLFGGPGDDVLRGASGRDVLNGGAGDDWLRGQGTSGDLLTGGPGTDIIDGGAGTDRIVENFPQSKDIVLTAERLSVDGELDELRQVEQANLDGGEEGVFIDARTFAGPVTLIGGAGADRLFAGDNNDILFGLAGNDILDSGAGNDWLLGAAGRDVLRGGEGDDNLRGQGSSGDRLIGGGGSDRLDGGGGADIILSDALDTVINDVLDVLVSG